MGNRLLFSYNMGIYNIVWEIVDVWSYDFHEKGGVIHARRFNKRRCSVFA